MNCVIANTSEVHKEYSKYISGKRVIFVGPASNMIGRGLGKWIDSFDVVIRTNHFPVLMKENKSLAIDYGKKCHVLYTNMQYYHKMRPYPIDIYKSIGIKWLCMRQCKDVDYRMYHRNFKVRVIWKSDKQIKKFIKVPLMGNVIIYDVSECIPGELAVVGIDFYKSSGDNYSAYVPGYISKQIQKENEKLKLGQGVGHNPVENARYTADMYDRGMITMPDFILKSMREVLQ
jgi:hypothetical protein